MHLILQQARLTCLCRRPGKRLWPVRVSQPPLGAHVYHSRSHTHALTPTHLNPPAHARAVSEQLTKVDGGLEIEALVAKLREMTARKTEEVAAAIAERKSESDDLEALL